MRKLQFIIIGIAFSLTLIWAGYTLATCGPDYQNLHARADVSIVGFVTYKAWTKVWCTGGITHDGHYYMYVQTEYSDSTSGTFVGSLSPRELSSTGVAGSAYASSAIDGYAGQNFWCAGAQDSDS